MLEEDVDFGDLIAPPGEEFNEEGIYASTELAAKILRERVNNPFFHGYSMNGVPKNWGLKTIYLNALNEKSIRAVHRGKHNIILPDIMRNVLNLDEQIAIELATGLVKSNVEINHQDFSDNPYELIKTLDKFSYAKGLIAGFAKKIAKNKPHSAMRGDRKSRLEAVDSWVLDKFVESFKKPYYGDFYLSSPNSKINLVKQQIMISYENQYNSAINSQ